MKTLKQILEVYSPKSADEKRFVKKHITVKTPDPAGNKDDVYQATNIKTIDRAKERKGHDAKAAEAVYEEEQIDELKKSTVGSYIQKKFAKMSDEPASKNPNEIFAKKDAKGIRRAGLRMSGVKATQKEEIKVYEEEQIDELSKSTLGAYIKKSSRERGFSGLEAGSSGAGNKDQKAAVATMKKRQAGVIKAVDRLTKDTSVGYTNEEFKDINDPLIEEMLNEVLAKDAKAADYISDFVKSDDPKFAGKSKAKRIQMALGAYYSKQRGE